LLAGALSVIPAYHNIFDQPWQRTFVNEEAFNFYKTAYRLICFQLFPLLALFNVLAAWKIFKHVKRIPGDRGRSDASAVAA